MRIYNFGSINIDLIYRVSHIPQPGETILSSSLDKGLGGKGANTSIALAEAGAEVVHVGAISIEDNWLLDELKRRGVNCDLVQQLDTSTGHAVVQVADDGENAITLAAGANHDMPSSVLDGLFKAATPGDWLVVQNETAHVKSAVKRAKSEGLLVAYVAAPFDAARASEILAYVDLLAVNEVEAAQLKEFTGLQLAEIDISEILVTQGALGATVFLRGDDPVFEPAASVSAVVDTTCAGDTFFGYYLANRLIGDPINMCMKIASAAAACAVEVSGAANSIPTLTDVRQKYSRIHLEPQT